MKPKLPADFHTNPDGRSQAMAVEIPFGILVRRNISEQCDVFARRIKPNWPEWMAESSLPGPNSSSTSARVYRRPERPNSRNSGCRSTSMRCRLWRVSF